MSSSGAVKISLTLFGTFSIISVVVSLLVASIPTVYKCTDGLNCWDLNGNGKCDLETEDVYSDGQCNYRDCNPIIGGMTCTNGTIGINCWDLNGNRVCDLSTEDRNSDGECTSADCLVVLRCVDCWDLNQNYQCDLLTEDVNFDGVCDVLDCKGPPGEDGCTCYQCYDLNKDGFCNLDTEDIDGDGECTELDCRGVDGFDCWDLNMNYECDPDEDINNDTLCTPADCRGPTGPVGYDCWDLYITNRICDIEFEDVNGDGICDESDCQAIHCWDKNQDRVCDLDTEDINGDGNCTSADCNPAMFEFSSLNVPNSIILRDETGSFAANVFEVNVLSITETIIGAPGSNITANSISVSEIISSGDFTITTPDPTVNDVIVNDDLFVTGTIYVDSITTRPLSQDLIISANEIILNGSVSFTNINSYLNGDILVQADISVNGTFGASIISSYSGADIIMNSQSGTAYMNADISVAETLFVDYIDVNSQPVLEFLSPISAGEISVDTIISNTGTITVTADNIYVYGDLRVDEITTPSFDAVVFGNGIESPLVTAPAGQPLTLYADSNIVQVVGALKVDNITSYLNNVDLLLVGSGSGNVSVATTLKTDVIKERTSSASTTVLSGLKFSNSASGYTPTKLDFYEVLTQSGYVISTFNANYSVSFKFCRIGPTVWVSLADSFGGLMATTSNLTINSAVIVSNPLEIPSRMRPSSAVSIPIFCLAPTQQTTCAFHLNPTTGVISFSNGGVPFTSGTTVFIFGFTRSYTT